MLQYPINVYPDKVAFTPTNASNDRDLHFTFKGDFLSVLYWRVFDYDTGEKKLDNVICEPDLSPFAYNNETVNATGLFGTLPTGRSYILQMMMGQVEYDENMGVYYKNCDRFVCRGELLQDYTANSQSIFIEDKINVIYEWNKDGNLRKANYYEVTHGGTTENVQTATLVMCIGDDRTVLGTYNYVTGEVTLKAPLPMHNHSKGETYEIYADYLITEQYYFETCDEPSLSNVNVEFLARGMRYTANFSLVGTLARTQSIKYYTLDIYKQTSQSSYSHIRTTPKMYTNKIDYTFVDDYDMSVLGGNASTRGYRFVFTGVLQNGITFTHTKDVTMPQRDTSTPVIENVTTLYSKSSNSIMVNIGLASGASTTNKGFRIYRVKCRDNGSYEEKKLIADNVVTTAGAGYKDLTPSSHAKYRYMAVAYDDSTTSSTTIYNAAISEPIETNDIGYTITALVDTNRDYDNYNCYVVADTPINTIADSYTQGDTWKFLTDIQDSTITQNINHELHVGYGKYSTATSVDTDYLSGTVSGMIGTLQCEGKKYLDTIEIVQAWRKFISQNTQFILKSQKGDVWLVNIVDNPTTEYQENAPTIPTRFTFSWAECGSLDDIIICHAVPYLNYTTERW